MYSGPPAARRLEEYSGSTIHRRSLICANIIVDLHLRIAQHLLGTMEFSSGSFLNSLGQELGNLSPEMYEELVEAIMKASHGPMGGKPLTRLPVLFSFKPNEDTAMYKSIGKTRVYGALRFMMCKLLFYITWTAINLFCRILLYYISANK